MSILSNGIESVIPGAVAFLPAISQAVHQFSPICGWEDPLLVCALQTAGENDNSEIGYVNEE
jgi:hypothetical protein